MTLCKTDQCSVHGILHDWSDHMSSSSWTRPLFGTLKMHLEWNAKMFRIGLLPHATILPPGILFFEGQSMFILSLTLTRIKQVLIMNESSLHTVQRALVLTSYLLGHFSESNLHTLAAPAAGVASWCQLFLL